MPLEQITASGCHIQGHLFPWMTSARVTYLYDLMDSAFDVPEIAAKCRELGHVPIIDHKTRRGEKPAIEAKARARRTAGYRLAKDVRLTTSAAQPSASTAT